MRMTRRALLRQATIACGATAFPALSQASAPDIAVPILVYHRFASTAQDSMTVRIATFADQLKALQDIGCEVIALRDLVDFRMGRRLTLPDRPVVITADDGHRSQFEVMAPMLADRGLCATFFIYPSAISRADYAMTWLQLQALALRNQWAFGAHTWWHPNFFRDRERMPAQDYEAFVDQQLRRARMVLSERLTRPIDWLAWPFGLEDAGLRDRAQACGYQAALKLGNRPDMEADSLYAMPRYLVTEAMSAKALVANLWHAFDMNGQ
jgi:peptidoglycan/xylan/chitin deacetylase (PgdA/CDA1 family)